MPEELMPEEYMPEPTTTVETTTETVVTVDVIQSVCSDQVHVQLFCSFLICGLLIGLFLLRGLHGT